MKLGCVFPRRYVVLTVAGMLFTTYAHAQQFFSCTFAASPTECGFTEQAKLPGRATIVGVGRDGTTSVRLHTEPGDNNVVGSGEGERNDLLLTAEASGCVAGGACEGVEQWWAHSIRFPNDFADPRWHPYVVFDFHNTAPGPIQANFHVNFRARPNSAEYGDLVFTGYGGSHDQNKYEATIKQGGATPTVTKNSWYDFVYHVRWSSTAGFFDAWVRKDTESEYKRVLAHQGPTLYSGEGVYLKLANYHLPVCDPYHPPFPQKHCADFPYEQPPSSVLHDRVIGGAKWQDVVLAGFSLEGQHEENAATYEPPSSWVQLDSGEGIFSGGTAVASNVANATATFTFTGTTVAWMGTKCNTCGSASVSIDGGASTTVNTFDGNKAPPNLTSEGVYTASGLALGSHTMVITNLSGAYVAVDGFWVNPIAPN